MTSAPDAYARSTYHGKPLDYATIAAVKAAEEILGYELTILQGIGGAAASAGTHLGLNGEGGRAVDFSAWDKERKMRALKRVGFAVWHRPELDGVWGEHLHAINVLGTRGNARGLAPAGFRQIASFDRGRNGLIGDGPDLDPWRPVPLPVFTYPPKKEPVVPPTTKITEARDALVRADAALSEARAALAAADPSRVAARNQRDEIRDLRAGTQAVLDALPKR